MKMNKKTLFYVSVLFVWTLVVILGTHIVYASSVVPTEEQETIDEEQVVLKDYCEECEIDVYSLPQEMVLERKLKKEVKDFIRNYNPELSEVLAEKIVDYSKKFNLDAKLLASLIAWESGFNQYATNRNRNGTLDRGLCQVNELTWEDFNYRYVIEKYGVLWDYSEAYDIDKNLEFLCWNWTRLSELKHLNTDREVLVAYNRGPYLKRYNYNDLNNNYANGILELKDNFNNG